ncbi:cation diffusion facilitator family transporter [Candidatus Halobeggiatoa sp. HSG11]|nr:cation diffusion facilitator family transporter [Candidatus Halobeggiatoa sp. HSG11]
MSISVSKQERYIAIRNVTILSVIANSLLTIVKITFGFIGNSHALIADGIHSFSSLAVDAMVLLAAKYSIVLPDARHPYGHGRYETLVTLAAGLLLIVMAIGLFSDAYEQLIGKQPPSEPANIVLIIAFAAIIIKEAIYHYTVYIANQVHSPMLVANAWHHRSDALSSSIVFISVLGYMAGYLWVDAVGTIIIASMIAYVGFEECLPAINKLIDTSINRNKRGKIKRIVESIDGVYSMQMLRTRKMGINILVDMHIVVAPRISISEAHQITEIVRDRLLDEMEEIVDVLIHVKPENAITNLDLPQRSKVISRLQTQSIDAVEKIEKVTLHYLDGKLSLDIDLPLNIIQDNSQAQLISKQFANFAINEPDIQTVNVYYHGTVYGSPKIFQVNELREFIQEKIL